MSRRQLRVLVAVLFSAVSLAFVGTLGHATTITYEAVDLTDTTPGQDLWQYSYMVSGLTPSVDTGFTIYFPLGLYDNLEDPPPTVNADWDLFVAQPDPGLPAAGIYDALALVDGASLADPFTLSFVWLGGQGTRPGAQAFEVYQLDTTGAPAIVESGRTVPSGPAAPVPEPGTIGLLALGLAGLAGVRARKR